MTMMLMLLVMITTTTIARATTSMTTTSMTTTCSISRETIHASEPSGKPRGGEFAFAEANAYYSARPIKQCPWGAPHRAKFACTDVTYLDGVLYVVTGYCDGDFVLTAREEGGAWRWGALAWGGKGDGAAQFRTAHGIFAHDGHIFVANREAHQVIEFTKTGELVRHLPDIPDTARICNVARANEYVASGRSMVVRQPFNECPVSDGCLMAVWSLSDQQMMDRPCRRASS